MSRQPPLPQLQKQIFQSGSASCSAASDSLEISSRTSQSFFSYTIDSILQAWIDETNGDGIENYTYIAQSVDMIKLRRSYTEVTELNAELVHEFIVKMMIDEAEYTPARFSHWARRKTQGVRIIYNYLGDISKIVQEE